MADADPHGSSGQASKPSRILGPDPVFERMLLAALGAPATVVFLACCLVLFVLAEANGSTREVVTLIRFGATERSQEEVCAGGDRRACEWLDENPGHGGPTAR